jgi:hypothetical protein
MPPTRKSDKKSKKGKKATSGATHPTLKRAEYSPSPEPAPRKGSTADVLESVIDTLSKNRSMWEVLMDYGALSKQQMQKAVEDIDQAIADLKETAPVDAAKEAELDRNDVLMEKMNAIHKLVNAGSSVLVELKQKMVPEPEDKRIVYAVLGKETDGHISHDLFETEDLAAEAKNAREGGISYVPVPVWGSLDAWVRS